MQFKKGRIKVFAVPIEQSLVVNVLKASSTHTLCTELNVSSEFVFQQNLYTFSNQRMPLDIPYASDVQGMYNACYFEDFRFYSLGDKLWMKRVSVNTVWPTHKLSEASTVHLGY